METGDGMILGDLGKFLRAGNLEPDGAGEAGVPGPGDVAGEAVADHRSRPGRRAEFLEKDVKKFRPGFSDAVLALSLIHISEPTRPY